MKQFLLSIVVFAVTGCVAKNEVLTKSEWDEIYGNRASGGVVFSLPQSRLRLDYVLNQIKFTPGDHTRVVDYCADDKVPDEETREFCRKLQAAGFEKSLRFSDPENRSCEHDGEGAETRVVLAEGSTVTTEFIPDASETYVIPLKRSYFQNFEVGLELNANGTVGKGSLMTENLGTQEFLAVLSEAAGKALKAAAELTPQRSGGVVEVARPTDGEFKAAIAALSQYEKLKLDRDEIAARNNDDALASRAVQLAALDARIARVVAEFVGALASKKVRDRKVHWIPAAPDSAKPKKAKISAELAATAATDHSEAGSPVLESTESSQLKTSSDIAGAHWLDQSYNVCGAGRTSDDRRLLVVVRKGQPEFAPLATGKFVPESFDRARGWPYRVPREVEIEWHVCNTLTSDAFALASSGALEVQCKRIDGIRQLMPQFGVTLRLPEKTGGRKSAIAPEYYVDGSLKKLTISHVGESPAPVIAAVKTALTPEADMPEPTEVAQLTAEASLINARQALCRLVFSVTATDPLCLGPNPPTTRPESE